MEYDKDKVDEVVLALLYLNSFPEGNIVRAWKSFDWGAMDRLYEKGFITSPKSKAKSIVLTEEGLKASEKSFKKHFTV
ncbi:MAG: DUF6429 family protein [Anaerolineales bacterium]|jgi:hypothetical protein